MEALLGSSVNFTWGFSGGIGTVHWGLAKAGFNVIDTRLVSIGQLGFVTLTMASVYAGRVNGRRSGNSSSGKVIFSLSNITKDDERGYGCMINPTVPVVSSLVDAVHLTVVGEYYNHLSI